MLYWLSIALVFIFSSVAFRFLTRSLPRSHVHTSHYLSSVSDSSSTNGCCHKFYCTHPLWPSVWSLSHSISLINDALSARLPKYNVAKEVQRIINLQNWTIWQKCILVTHCKESMKLHWHETVTFPLPHLHHNSCHKTCFLVATMEWITDMKIIY